MQSQKIIFDLDDTLIYCGIYFKRVLAEYILKVVDFFGKAAPHPVDLANKYEEIERSQIMLHGFKKERFPLSLVETYRYFCGRVGRTPDPVEEKEIFELGFSVYDHEVELLPGAIETLQTLQNQGHYLALLTMGDHTIQSNKINAAGLAPFFQKTYITSLKNRDTYRKLVEDLGGDYINIWMVGNSPHTDIRPALEVGLNCIYIPADTWSFEQEDLSDFEAKYYITECIKDVPYILQQSFGKRLGGVAG